jgi:hypothetical protein
MMRGENGVRGKIEGTFHMYFYWWVDVYPLTCPWLISFMRIAEDHGILIIFNLGVRRENGS